MIVRKFNQAKYWVGCSTEQANEILFDLEKVLTRRDEFAYIAAFDENGKWIDEAKVEFEEGDKESWLNFAF